MERPAARIKEQGGKIMRLRSEIPAETTWDLTHLYRNESDFNKDLDDIRTLMSDILSKKGRLAADAAGLLQVLQWHDRLGILLERAAGYARMSFDVDMGDPASKERYETMDNLLDKLSDQLSFVEPELLRTTPEAFDAFLKEEPRLETYRFSFEKLFQQKAHVRSESEEEILSRMGSLGGAFGKIYDDLVVNDLPFSEIPGEDGQPVLADEANYRKILGGYNRDLRERYFSALLNAYGSHVNAITSVLAGNVKSRVFAARTRLYPSSRHMALARNHIPIEVYDNLIATVRAQTEPLQDYLALRRETLGYDTLHFYDLFVPLTEDSNRAYTCEEARDTVLEALQILGEPYVQVLREAFSQRWIDVYPNKGKTPGAYANGIYGVHPYSLLNFAGTLDDLFTMAHELGHVMHSYYSNLHQPFVNSGYAIFAAEVASTVNENLLYRHLLKKAQNPREKNHLLSMHLDAFRSTLYRQAFFADFEMTLHHMAETDVPLTPQSLCARYKELYALYYGPEFAIDECLQYEWARIPHFYNSFYVYQYATGISAAVALAQGILENKPGALDAYLAFLRSGGSDYPIALLQKAGVDMSSPDPILAAADDFRKTLAALKTNL
jgi:oligoendopeptidase F